MNTNHAGHGSPGHGSKARTPSEHPIQSPLKKAKMGGAPTAPTPKWDPIGFDPQPPFRLPTGHVLPFSRSSSKGNSAPAAEASTAPRRPRSAQRVHPCCCCRPDKRSAATRGARTSGRTRPCSSGSHPHRSLPATVDKTKSFRMKTNLKIQAWSLLRREE